MTLSWGLLGPGELAAERRVRTLGVSASVRHFNELAVPGLGGVWFGKQVMLATLGVMVAQGAREYQRQVNNIETANAIEALACWLGFERSRWQAVPRLRGVNKMRGVTKEKLTFRRLREQKFYVTQPMRMSTVEALPALGLVDANGTRFNTFACSEAGQAFIEAACAHARPKNRTVADHLIGWTGDGSSIGSLDTLGIALMPTLPLPERARALLTERLRSRGRNESANIQKRRCEALDWVEAIRLRPSVLIGWDDRPYEIESDAHWNDLRAGAFFTLARDAAIDVLDALEAQIGKNEKSGNGKALSLRDVLPGGIRPKLDALRGAAQRFHDEKRTESEANHFCDDCLLPDDKRLLRELVKRDGRVLRLRGDDVVPGSAYQGREQREAGPARNEGDGESAAPDTSIDWPAGLSFRVRNLFLLNADLHGDLERWLNRENAVTPMSESELEEAV
ncbi:hypothetical protein [Caballeronia sp. INML3B]|uniref:hypothetical protein n=1 Tax=Caballeronia sp. INML3B TaxID=2921749 RepID=UPI00202866DE|nr:hypothetical protein [Caballeronia sp. INML3B]